MEVSFLSGLAPVLGAIAGTIASVGAVWAFIRKPVEAINGRLDKLDDVVEGIKEIDRTEKSVGDNNHQIARLESAMNNLQHWRQPE